MAMSHGTGFVYSIIESDEERVNIHFLNENLALNQFVARTTETGVSLSFITARGKLDLDLTPEFAQKLALSLLNEAQKKAE